MGLAEVAPLLTVLPVAVMWAALREQQRISHRLLLSRINPGPALLTFFLRCRQTLHFCVSRVFVAGPRLLYMATYWL